MKTKVKVVDDTCTRGILVPITPEMRLKALKRGRVIPEGIRIIQGYGHETVRTIHTYEGQFLKNMVRRAKRYMRSGKLGYQQPPRHIFRAMAAFRQADPQSFDNEIKVARAIAAKYPMNPELCEHNLERLNA